MKKRISKSLVFFMIFTLILTNIFSFGGIHKAEAQSIYATDLFFSEYIEGSSYNKAIEIFNGTGTDVDLSEYSVVGFTNGASQDPSDGKYANAIQLEGILEDGEVYVIANSGADVAITSIADNIGNSYFYGFNGDDAIVLFKNYDPDTRQGIIIDVFGKVGEDPGDYWGTGDITTKDHTLVRKSSITSGDTDSTDVFDPSVEWDSYPMDTFSYLGSHSIDGSIPKVANVTALPAPGAVEAGTEITLSTATEGATVYYAIYADSYEFIEFNAPLVIDEPTTILAKAEKEGLEPSDISTFEYTIKELSTVIPISEARNKSTGEEATIQGIVTFVESSTLMYIQDETAGVKIDTYGKDVYLSSFQAGDMVQVTGVIDFYKDEMEISLELAENIVLISSDNSLPEPRTIKISDILDNQGQLVQVKMAKITDTTSDKYSFFIEDESGSTKLYHSKAADFIKEDYNAGEYYDIIGIAAIYSSPQLKLRSGLDMQRQLPQDPDALLPVVYNLKPANMASTFDTKPIISATLERGKEEIDISSIKLYIDENEVETSLDGSTISYTPDIELTLGEHDVRLEVSDITGQKKVVEWYFVIADADEQYNFYYGIPHAHTSYSDGKGTPTDAYNYARNNDLDFLIVSDHSNWFDGVQDNNYEYNEDTNQYEEKEGSEWYNTRIQAEAFNDSHDDFLALRGFEMTSSDWGHMNVTNSESYVEAKKQMTDLYDFYDWIAKQEDVVAAFNHPNWPDDSFNDLAYVPELDRMLSLIEVGNGAPPYSYARAEGHYFKALDNGWHVAAINGQDNHSENWGDPDNLTVVLADNLDTESFMEAMRNRRTYSTETRTLKLSVKANGFWMGSLIDAKAGDTLHFDIIAEDEQEPIEQLQLITNGGNIVDSTLVNGQNRAEWNPSVTLKGGAEWFVVKVIHCDNSWGTSSPIFTPSSENDVKLISLEVNPDTTIPGYETAIEATVANMGIRDVSDIEVKFYENEVSDENLIGIDNIEGIKAGENAVFNTTWMPSESGKIKIIAKLTEIEGITTVTELATTVKVVPSNGKTVLIDAAHKNADVPGAMLNFMELLRRYGYTVKLNNAPITEETLNGVDVLVLNTPYNNDSDFTADEENLIAKWVKAGGSTMISAKSNHNNDSTLMNSLMETIGTNIRFNDDNVYEPEDSDKYSGGMVWSVYAYNLPEAEHKLNKHMEAIRIFSGCSLVNAENSALINSTETELEILLGGNATSYNANPGDNAYVYNIDGELNGESIPIIAKENIEEGKIVAAGRHFYSDFEIVNDVSNTAFTLKLIDYLAGIDRIKDIEDVRHNSEEGDIVTVMGTVTSPTDNFFDVVYIEDKKSGVCLYGSQGRELPLGTEVIATGIVEYFEGELEIAFDNFNYEILYVGPVKEIKPKKLSTQKSMLSEYTGTLITTSGRIVEYNQEESYFIIDDGSGEAYIHVDGYIGADMGRFMLGDYVEVTGIASIGAAGPRIRVRFYDDIQLKLKEKK